MVLAFLAFLAFAILILGAGLAIYIDSDMGLGAPDGDDVNEDHSI